ncbi:MAG: DUF4340 domain-containing protein [Bacteroidota bacterium]
MNNKYLFAIFGALLALYFASQLFSTKKERSFKAELVQVDTSAVDKIVLQTKADQYATVTLEKVEDNWRATKGNKSVTAMSPAVQALLGQLVMVKAKRIAAKTEEKWGEYEVDEANGNRIQVFAGDRSLCNFVIGRFSFDQNTRTATSFLRLQDAPDVYAIDGFLSMSFGQGFNAYRLRDLVKLRAEDITNISFGDGQALQKGPDGWLSGEGTALDSTEVANYLSGMSNITGSNFIDDFDASGIAPENIQQMTIKANNALQAIVISAYKREDAELPYVIHSSINPDAYFTSKAEDLYAKLFKTVDSLE